MMYTAIMLMLLAAAPAETPAASVSGSVKVVQAGDPLTCAAALLIPRSNRIDAAIQQRFGRLDEGARLVPDPVAPAARGDYPAGSREVSCHGRFSEQFEFPAVPAGEYFVTVSAVPTRYDAQLGQVGTAVELMQRVVVAPGRPVKLDFRYRQRSGHPSQD